METNGIKVTLMKTKKKQRNVSRSGSYFSIYPRGTPAGFFSVKNKDAFSKITIVFITYIGK